MVSLYDILDEYSDTIAWAELGDDATYKAKLNEIEGELDEKMANICGYHKNEQAEIDALDTEIRKLKDKKLIKERALERLEHYIEYCIGHKRWSNGVHTLTWRSSKRVEPTADNAIGYAPEQYSRIKTTVEPNKILIKQDIECGATIPGWQLIEAKTLQVK